MVLDDLLQAAKEVEQNLLADVTDDLQRAIGARYVAGLLRWELQRALTAADPNYPCFLTAKDPVSKWGGENPDNLMRTAAIDGTAEYVIEGDRGSCAEVIFQVLTVVPGDSDEHLKGGVVVSMIDTDQLQVDPDGRYTIQVGGTPPEGGGNYLAGGPTAREVFVRHIFGRDDESAGWIRIRRLTPPSAPPLNAEAAVGIAARRLRSASQAWRAHAQRWSDQLPVNTAAAPTPAKNSQGWPGQCNTHGQFKLEEKEALLVSMDEVPCRYSGLAIINDHWFHSFDYQNAHSSLNNLRAHRSSDGRFHYAISVEDPGIPNWLDTNGLRSGFFMLRWSGLRPDVPTPALPEIRVVPVAEVANHVPADEPTVTEEERNAAIAAHRAVLHRRFFGS